MGLATRGREAANTAKDATWSIRDSDIEYRSFLLSNPEQLFAQWQTFRPGSKPGQSLRPASMAHDAADLRG
jgi:hypothetical protein